LLPEPRWLDANVNATLIRKDCSNGFVGVIAGQRYPLIERATENALESLLVVGICTDICVTDLVLTLLSARNHNLMPQLVDIFVRESACAIYDLPSEQVKTLNLQLSWDHLKATTQYMGVISWPVRARLVTLIN